MAFAASSSHTPTFASGGRGSVALPTLWWCDARLSGMAWPLSPMRGSRLSCGTGRGATPSLRGLGGAPRSWAVARLPRRRCPRGPTLNPAGLPAGHPLPSRERGEVFCWSSGKHSRSYHWPPVDRLIRSSGGKAYKRFNINIGASDWRNCRNGFRRAEGQRLGGSAYTGPLSPLHGWR